MSCSPLAFLDAHHCSVVRRRFLPLLALQWLCLQLSLAQQQDAVYQNNNNAEAEKIYIQTIERRLAKNARAVMSFEQEEIRKKNIEDFNANFISTLQISASFDHPFDSLPQVSKLHSPDRRFRIYTWSYPHRDGKYTYYGCIQIPSQGRPKVIVLNDVSDKIMGEDVFFMQGSPQKWFGALYYKIVAKQVGDRTLYTLLGWDGNTPEVAKKLVEPLFITPQGRAIFGLPIFMIGDDIKRMGLSAFERRPVMRLIYSYSGSVSMQLNYQKDLDMIVMDNLSSFSRELKGNINIRDRQKKRDKNPKYFSPDMTVNVMHFQNGRWILTKNIDLDKLRKQRSRQLLGNR